MSTENLGLLLAEADRHLQNGTLDEADTLYQRVLEQAPNNQGAQQGLQRLGALRQLDEEIREQIAQGDVAANQQDYSAALRIYDQAMNRAGQSHLLKYHAELEHKRTRMRELAAFRQRVEEVRGQVADVHHDKDLADTLLEQIVRLLRDIPVDQKTQEQEYTQMEQEIRSIQETIEQQIDVQDRVQRANKAFNDEDFEQTLRLVQSIPRDSSAYQDIQTLQSEADRILRLYIQPAMQRVEEAYQEQRWADAFAELDKLRLEFPKNPAWQNLWSRVGIDHGKHLLREGRDANINRNFERAQQCFNEARQAFQKVLEVYATHEGARRYLHEADDLVAITLRQIQANRDWELGNRAEALSGLDDALKRIEYAREDERDHAAIGAVVQTTRSAIQKEIERIEHEQKLVEDGEWLLNAGPTRDLDKAIAYFEEASHALLPHIQKRARDGLQQAKKEREQFFQDMEEGKNTPSLETRVQKFENAYQRWNQGPDIQHLLVQTLNEAGEEALSRSDEPQAMTHFARVLEIDPDNARARHNQQRPGISTRVATTLEQNQKHLIALSEKDPIAAADFAPIVQALEALCEDIQTYPDLHQQVEQKLTMVRTRQQRWTTYEQHYQEACQHRDEGDWDTAVQVLQTALDHLEESKPSLNELLKAWQSGRETITLALQKARSLWEETRQHYDTAAGKQQELESVLSLLQQLKEALQPADDVVRTLGGTLPPDMQQLSIEAQSLHERATAMQEVLSVTEGVSESSEVSELSVINNMRTAQSTILALQGQNDEDPVLKAVETEFAQRVAARIPDALAHARQVFHNGNSEQAIALLEEIRELAPEHPDIPARIQEIQAYDELADTVHGHKRASDALLLNGNKRHAVRELETALEKIAAALIPGELGNTIRTLITDSRREDGEWLAKSENYDQARTHIETLRDPGHVQRLVHLAADLFDTWLNLAHDMALYGTVSSMAIMGDYVTSCRAAVELYQKHPDTSHPDAVEAQKAKDAKAERDRAIVALSEHLSTSATTRMERAEQAIKRGQADEALAFLQAIVTEVFQPVLLPAEDLKTHRFEDMSENWFDPTFRMLALQDPIAMVAARCRELRNDAHILQRITQDVEEPFRIAKQDYAQGKFLDVEERLDTLVSLVGESSYWENQVKNLRTETTRARTRQAQRDLREAVLQADTRLKIATTGEYLEPVLTSLQELPLKLGTDWDLLSDTEHTDHTNVLQRVQNQIEEFRALDEWEKTYLDAWEEQDYMEAERVLKHILEKTRDGKKKAETQTRLDTCSPLADRQRRAGNLLDEGKKALIGEQYREARDKFLQAQDMGAQLDESLLRVARAGMRYQEALDAWSEAGRWSEETARLALTSALEMLGEPVRVDEEDTTSPDEHQLSVQSSIQDAQDLRNDIQQLQQRVETESTGIKTELESAQQALNANDTNKQKNAKQAMQTILQQFPGLARATTLLQEIEQRELQATIAGLLAQAKDAQSRSEYETARSHVNAVLKKDAGHLEAQALLEDLDRCIQEQKDEEERLRQEQNTRAEQQQQARALLQKIEQLAESGHFGEAYEQLQYATQQGASPDDVEQTMDRVRDREAGHKDDVVYAVRGYMNNEEFSLALQHCSNGLENITTRSLRTELENLQGTIVQRWIDAIQKDIERQRKGKTADSTLRLGELERWRELWTELESVLSREQKRLVLEEMLVTIEQDMAAVPDGSTTSDSLHTIEEIKKHAERIRIDAQVAELGNLDLRASRVVLACDRRRKDITDLEQTERRDQLLAAARSILDILDEEPDASLSSGRLNQIQHDIQNALGNLRALQDDGVDDVEVTTLLKEMEKAKDGLEQTLNAIEQSATSVGRRRFDEARRRLRGVRPSPIVKQKFDAQRDLVDMLLDAQRLQDRAAWREALQTYRMLAQHSSDMGELLEEDRENCRNHISRDVVETVEEVLATLPLDIEAARVALQEARDKDWITASYADRMKELEKQVSGYSHIAQAANLLEQDNGDPTVALKALEQARNLVTDEPSRRTIEQWSNLARAIRSWQEGDLSRAESFLDLVQFEEERIPRLYRLRQSMQQAREVSAAIQTAEETIREAQGSSPPNPGKAVDTMVRVRNLAPEDPRTQQLMSTVQIWLQEMVERLQQQGSYQQAIDLGEQQLVRLDPDNRDLREQVSRLHDQRVVARDQAIEQIEQALHVYDIATARTALTRAETIVSPHHHEPIRVLHDRVEEQSAFLATIDGILHAGQANVNQWYDAMRDLMRRVEWNVEEAVQHTVSLQQGCQSLHQAQTQAPQYAAVIQAIQHALEHMKEVATFYRTHRRFALALELCEQMLFLERRDDLVQFQEHIVRERETLLDDLRQRVKQALDAWDVATAAPLLQQGLTIAPEDVVLQQLETLREQVEMLGNDLKQTMQAGWDALEQRAYDQAIRQFEEASRLPLRIETLAPFREARLWRDYSQSLKNATELVRKDSYSYTDAVHALNQAREHVSLNANESIPSVILSRDYILQQRRQFCYFAERLGEIARRFDTIARAYGSDDNTDDTAKLDELSDLYDKLQETRTEFVSLSPSKPPDAYQPWETHTADSVGQPSAETVELPAFSEDGHTNGSALDDVSSSTGDFLQEQMPVASESDTDKTEEESAI